MFEKKSNKSSSKCNSIKKNQKIIIRVNVHFKKNIFNHVCH